MKKIKILFVIIFIGLVLSPIVVPQKFYEKTSNFIYNKLIYSINYLTFLKNDLKNHIIDNSKIIKIKKDRIIAHAGGGIDGFTYTNSLEALNSNYNKGMRYFELDLRQTSDNIYVGVHDWKEWKLKTNFNGNIPPTHKEFIENKIHNKFTPLDLNAINNWFKNHESCVLFIDKINKPTEIFKQIEISKDKVIMELFSWESILEAKTLGINVMASWEVFFGVEDHEIYNKLKDNHIRYLAIPNQLVYTKSDLLEKISPFVKTYSWGSYRTNPNNIGNKTESYVLCEENKFIYGVFMDFSNLESDKIICNEAIGIR